MASVFDTFFMDGTTAEDFYFIYNTQGRKLYYSRRTGQKTSKDRIPAKVLSSIEEMDTDLSGAALERQKQCILDQIAKLQKKVADIDNKINNPKPFDYARAEAKEHEKKKASEKRRDEERKNFFNSIPKMKNPFGDAKKEANKKRTSEEQNNAKPEPKKQKVETPRDILKELSITTKQEWRAWLLKNHPDKGGTDHDICKNVIAAGKRMGW
jgi:hypothetical protein